MAKLYFRVQADFDKVIKLREEIAKLKNELKNMDSTQSPVAFKTLNTQLVASTQQMDELVTNAAKAGAVIEGGFKKKIFDASQSVNGFTEKIIAQKAAVKDIEADVKRLGEAYRIALKNNPMSSSGKLSEYTSAKKALDEEKAALFGLTQEQANARLSVKKLRDEYALYQNDGKQVVETNNGIAISWKKALAVIGGTAAIKKFISDLVNVRGEFQKTQMSFETMLGSKEKADKLMAQMVETAAKTPFDLQGVANGAKQLLAYGTEAENVNDTLIRLGNIASGLSIPLGDMVYLYGTTQTQGRLFTQDVRQFMGRGIPLVKELAAMLGKTEEEINKMVTAGQIGFSQVEAVIKKMTDEGGKFYNLMQKQSETLSGQISNLGDAWDGMLNSIGEDTQGLTSKTISMATSAVENYETVGKVLAGLIVTYGSYKAATIAVSVATNGLTMAENLLYLKSEALLKINRLLSVTMLNNPFVLLGTLVGALVAKMILFNGEQEKILSKSELLKKITGSYASELAKEKSELALLLSVAKNEKVSKESRLEAIQKLNDVSPKYLGNLNLENINTKLATDSVDQYTLSLERNAKTKAIVSQMQEIEEAKLKNAERLSNLKEKYANQGWFGKGVDWLNETVYNMPAGITGGAKPSIIADREETKAIQENNKELDKKYQLLMDINFENERGSKVNTAIPKNIQLEAEKKNLEYLKEEHAKLVEQMKNKPIGFVVDVLDQQKLDSYISQIKDSENKIRDLSKPEKSLVQDKAFWEKQKKAAETALESIASSQKKLMDAGNFKGIDSNIVDNYKKNSKLLKEAEKELGVYGSYTKQESQAEKLRQQKEKLKLLTDKQTREQARAEADEADKIEQLKIDRLKDGGEKTLKQRALNHKKELEAIEREAEDKKQKVIDEARTAFEANPDNKKKSFNAENFIKSEPAKKKFAVIDNVAKENKITSETKYNRGDDLTGLLNEYQDYTDKRLAIEKKFNDDLAVLDEQRKVAVEKGDTKQVEQIDRAKAQATANKGKELMGLDYEKMKESPEYVRAFENLKETSSETLNSLLSQFENAKQTAAKVLSPDQLREYTTTIQNIMDELDSRNPFQALTDKKQELAEAELELSNAQDALEKARTDAEAVKNGAKIQTGVRITGFDKKTGQVTSEKVYLSEAQALAKVKEKTDNYNAAKDKTTKASAKVKKAEKDVKAQIDELSKSISDVGDAIGGPAGEIISLIGSIGTFTMAAISGVQAAADTSANAISTVEKASVILAIISAAVQIAMKIFDLFGKDTTTEDYEKAKEAYESYINILDEVIDKQLELAETLAGDNANAAYEKAIELIKQQTEAAKVLGKQYLNSGASGKSHSKGYNEVDDMSAEGWADAAKALGMSVEQFKRVMGGRMTGLFDLTDEQLVQLQENAYIFWAQLDSDTQDYANQIAEGVAQVKDVLEQQMQDVTLIDVDTLRSDFQDLLTDMDSDTADFADNFEEYMRNAILNSMLKESYMDRLKKWREKFYNAMDDGMTQKEYEDLKAEGQQISSEMKDECDKLKDMFGWTDSYSQSSSKGGYQTMDQDTGEELNGRFTSLQMAGEEIKVQNTQQSQSLNILTIKTDAILSVNTETRNIADEIRTIQVNSYLELQEIRQNTGDTVKQLKLMDEKLKSIENNTKNM